MKYLIVFLLYSHIVMPVHADDDESPYYIVQAAKAFDLSPALLLSMCSIESRCNPKALNKYDSRKDANGKRHYNPSWGLFQFKCATARGLGYQGNCKGLFDPEINSFYAAKQLRQNIEKYHSTVKAISAHNAGIFSPLNTGYVNKVLTMYAELTLDRHIK